MADRYTKILLTVIAVCLVAQTIAAVTPSAYAFGSGQDVSITNLETDIRAGETLYVYCTNC